MYVCVPYAGRSPQKPEKDNGYSGTEVIGGCMMPDMGSGNQTGVSLYEYEVTYPFPFLDPFKKFKS